MSGGPVALVTGAARGTGRAVALRLASDGADVAVADGLDGTGVMLDFALPTADDLKATANRVEGAGRRALPLTLDVRDRGAVLAAVDEVEQHLGPLTSLVVASGIVSAVPVVEMSRRQWEDAVAANLHGAFYLLQAVVPRMAERGAGRAVVVVGPESRRGAPLLSHVSAAGWALIGLSKSLAQEVAGAGVTVNVVSAGPVRSEPALHSASFARARRAAAGDPGEDGQPGPSNPMARDLVEPEEVAAVVAFLLSDAARSMTGSVVDVDLGLASRNSA